ncbi:MAG: hypothetical protein ACLTOX_02470 [Streptococcus thermophilus]
MKEYEFVLWVVGATHKQKEKFVYTSENVVEVHEVFWTMLCQIKKT